MLNLPPAGTPGASGPAGSRPGHRGPDTRLPDSPPRDEWVRRTLMLMADFARRGRITSLEGKRGWECGDQEPHSEKRRRACRSAEEFRMLNSVTRGSPARHAEFFRTPAMAPSLPVQEGPILAPCRESVRSLFLPRAM